MSLSPPRDLRRSGRMAAARGLGANPGLGILCATGSGFFIVCNDIFAKLATEAMPVGQFILLRGGIASLLILGWLAATRQLGLLRTRNGGAMLLYALMMVGSTHCFLNALTTMPLGDATAITFAAPIFTTALAAMLLRETVGWRRWSAVGVGFVGVLVLLAPTGQGYPLLVALLPLTVALFVSVRDIVSRRLSVTDATVAILFYNTFAVTLSGFGAMPFEAAWYWPDGREILYAAAAAVLLAASQYLIVEAYRLAELSLIMPFRYSSLVFAAGAGFLVWSDVPQWNVALGAAIICLSGLFILHREKVKRA